MSKNTNELDDAQTIALARDLLSEYSKSGSITRSLEHASKKDTRYGEFLNLFKKLRLGHVPKIGECSLNGDSKRLYVMLSSGLENNSNIYSNLENFYLLLNTKINSLNTIRSKTEGMRVISLAGIVFFFPMFSGILGSIANSSLSSSNGFGNSIMLISFGYIAMCILLTNLFANPSKNIRFSITISIPMVMLAYMCQFLSFYLSSYAI